MKVMFVMWNGHVSKAVTPLTSIAEMWIRISAVTNKQTNQHTKLRSPI